MTVLSELLAKPNSKKIILAEITAGKPQNCWDKSWSPYYRSDLSFSVWASDIRGKNDGDEVEVVEETIKKKLFRKYSNATITYNKTDATANNRPTLSIDTENGASIGSIQDIVKTDYFSTTQFTWVCAFRREPSKGYFYPFGLYQNVARMGVADEFASLNAVHGGASNVSLDPGYDDGEWHVLRIDKSFSTYRYWLDGVQVGEELVVGTFDTTGNILMALFSHEDTGVNTKIGGLFLFKDGLSSELAAEFEAGCMQYYGISEDQEVTVYQSEETDHVESVYLNGTELTQADNLADCIDTLESWYWDGRTIYLNTATDPRELTNTVLMLKKYYFSSVGKILDGKYYEQRIKSISDMTLRVEDKFNAITQIGGGDIELANGDGFFDPRNEYRWDAGKTKLLLGCDYNDYAMEYVDYEPIGIWNNDSWKLNPKAFEISLIETKERIKKDIPSVNYTRDEYPGIHETHDGKPKTIAYGKIFGAEALCIDVPSKTFKVANHKIQSIDAVREERESFWRVIEVTAINLTEATFVYAGWDGQQAISADIHGKVDGDGLYLENPSDIVKDLLATIGETDIDAASFLESKNILDRGYLEPRGERVVSLAPCVYLNELTDVYDVISEINTIVGSYLYADALGKYHYKVFEPQRIEGLETFKEETIKNFKCSIETQDRLSYIHVNYAKRYSEGWGVDLISERTRNQLIRLEKNRISEEFEINVPDRVNAQMWVDKQMIYRGELNLIYEFDLIDGRALLLKPGDQIHIQYGKVNVTDEDYYYKHDVVLEIYEIRMNPLTNVGVSVIAGNRHGYGYRPGIWCADNEVLPTRFSGLAGYGDGSANVWKKSWHRRIKDFARYNYGYHSDDNGFSDPTDPESYMISTWS